MTVVVEVVVDVVVDVVEVINVSRGVADAWAIDPAIVWHGLIPNTPRVDTCCSDIPRSACKVLYHSPRQIVRLALLI